MSEESGNGGVVSGLFVLLFIILVPVLSLLVYVKLLLRKPKRAIFLFLSLLILVVMLVTQVSQTSPPITLALSADWLAIMFFTTIIVLILKVMSKRKGKETEEEFNKDDSVNHPMTTIGFLMFFYSWFLLDIGGVWSSDIAHLCYVLGYLMVLVGSMTLVVGVLVDKAGKVIKEVKNTNAFYN